MLKRINFNMEEDLVNQIDDFAKRMHVNRSAAFAFIATQYFEAQKAMSSLSVMAEAYRLQQEEDLQAK